MVDFTGQSSDCGNKDASIRLPRHWDDLPKQTFPESDEYAFSEQFIAKQLQPEFWWRRTKHLCESKSLKDSWLKHSGVKDDRHELTEYQVTRDVIWTLLGARHSFIYRIIFDQQNLMNNRVFCAKRVSLHHLTLSALDSLLDRIAVTCTHTVILRRFIIFTNDSVNYHPCIAMFISSIRKFLSVFDKFLCDTEETARSGTETLTLISLYTKLSTWSHRLRTVVDLVGQLTMGKLSNLTDKFRFISLLDILFIFTSTINDCAIDKWLIEFSYSLFFHCFYPILISVVQLLCGSLSIEQLKRLFVQLDIETLPTNPDFWFSSSSFFATDVLDSASIPRILNAKLLDLVTGVRSLGIIFSMASSMGNTSLIDPIRLYPEEMVQELGISVLQTSVCAHVSSMPMDCKAYTLSCFQDDNFVFIKDYLWQSLESTDSISDQDSSIVCKYSINVFQRKLGDFIVHRSDILSQYLMKLLLLPPRHIALGSRNLGSAVAAAHAVFLFGAGDKMCDFLRNLFVRHSTVKQWSGDLLGMTMGLRASFEKLDYGFQHRTSKSRLLLDHLQRFSFRFTEPTADVSKNDGNISLSSMGSTYLAFETEWPIDCLIDSSALATYSFVFNFMVQIKYAKWSLETLPFRSLQYLYHTDPATHHQLILIRINMLFVFTSLHDFLSHRMEALRLQFSDRWHLPDFNVPFSADTSATTMFPGNVSFLIKDHSQFLHDLASLCLLTDNGSMLRAEMSSLCRMVLSLRSLWLRPYTAGSEQQRAQFHTDLARVTGDFANHVKFLATLLLRCVRQTSAKRLLPIAQTFCTASSFL